MNHISIKNIPLVGFGSHNDHLGTPLALTDKDGVVVAEWKRDPFGVVVSKTGSVDDNNMFPGQVWDADAGLAYNWNRWYSPEIGRYVEVDPTTIFINTAPLLLGAQGLLAGTKRNLPAIVDPFIEPYAYVSGNPLRWIDDRGTTKRNNSNTVTMPCVVRMDFVDVADNGCTGSCLRRRYTSVVCDCFLDADLQHAGPMLGMIPWTCKFQNNSECL